MATTLGTKAVAAREAVVELAHSGLTSAELMTEVGERIRRVVPYSTSAYMALDPATHLPTHTYLHSVDPDLNPAVHLAYADNEYLVDDYAKMSDIIRSGRSVMTLREATGGDLSLSARHRDVHPMHNAEEELRAVFRNADAVWGMACISRDVGGGQFSVAEQDFIASLSEPIATGLRLALQFEGGPPLDPQQAEIPGIVVLRGDDSIESITPEAEAWLAQLPGDARFELPSPVYHVVRAARAATNGRGLSQPRGRARTTSGAWLLIRATQLKATDRAPARTAVVLEAARRSELAPLIVQLYELSQREREVTELLLRGLPIDEVARSLSISKHTVRDHTKAIFGKLGVTSRPELTAKLFHEHVLPDATFAAI